MILNRFKTALDRLGMKSLNENMDKIEKNFNGVVDVVANKAYNQVVDAAKLIWQEPVDTFADLATTYPNAEEGWASMARDTGVVYRYNSHGEWKPAQEISAGPFNEMDHRLSTQLAQMDEDKAEKTYVDTQLDKKVRYYRTAAALKADVDLKVGMECETLGYYAANDGGKATYYILDYELTSRHCERLNNGLWAILIDNGEFNIKQCGGFGDYASHPASSFFATLTDAQSIYPHCVSLDDEIDGLVIQKCLSKVVKNIYIPRGGYFVSTTLHVMHEGVVIYGDGKSATRLTYTQKTGDLFDVVNKPTTEIRDMTLWASTFRPGEKGPGGGVTSRAIYFDQSIRCIVRDVKINGFYTALHFGGLCYNIDIMDSEIHGNTIGLYGADDFNNVNVVNVRFQYCNDCAIIGHGYSVSFDMCLFEKNNRAIIKEDLGIMTVSKTYFERHDTNAIRIRPKSNVYPSIVNLEKNFFWREWDGTEITIEAPRTTIINMKENLFTNNTSTNPITTYAIGYVALPNDALQAKVNFHHNRMQYGMAIANAGTLALDLINIQ